MANERGFELGRHTLSDGRSFVIKASEMKYAEVYELHYQGQVVHFRPESFEVAKMEFDLQAPLRLGGNDEGESNRGSEEGRGGSRETVRGSGGEGDDRRGSESD